MTNKIIIFNLLGTNETSNFCFLLVNNLYISKWKIKKNYYNENLLSKNNRLFFYLSNK